MATQEDAAAGSRRWRRWVWPALLFVIVVAAVYAAGRIVQASRQGSAGRTSLLAAESALRSRDTNRAEALLRRAHAQFAAMHSDLDAMGPLLPVAKVVPLVRTQVRAAQTMATVGEQLSTAGIDLAESSAGILHPEPPHLPLAKAVADLKSVDASTVRAVAVLDAARKRMASLDGYRLIGPLGSTRDELDTRLGKVQGRAHNLADGLTLLLDIVGADGPRRYLVLTQNPDEIRPTGGYIGTYGVVDGDGTHVRLLDYGPSGAWALRHPKAQIPAAKAPFVFEYATPPQPQTISNVNTGPDWPAAARLAAQLWQQGGEAPVDGVLSMEPQVIAAMVKVYGEVRVPAYAETVTGADVQQRLDYYTHGPGAAGKNDVQRKDFVAELAHAVLQRTLDATSSEWIRAAGALQSTYGAREGMAWSARPDVERAIARLGWDGTLPAVNGDFYADAEFEFEAKNGSGIRRAFDHRVTLRPDGSGVAATTMTLRDTLPATAFANADTLSYLTPYGPVGATLDAASDHPDNDEPPIAGHPSAGWIRAAQPLGSTTLRVVWQARQLMHKVDDKHWSYTLTWLPQPGHTGDDLRLAVALPKGWRWTHGEPPGTVRLDHPFSGAWEVTSA